MKVKHLLQFLQEVDPEADVEIGYEQLTGCTEGTDIGYSETAAAQRAMMVRYESRKAVYTNLIIWGTSFPEVQGSIIKEMKGE